MAEKAAKDLKVGDRFRTASGVREITLAYRDGIDAVVRSESVSGYGSPDSTERMHRDEVVILIDEPPSALGLTSEKGGDVMWSLTDAEVIAALNVHSDALGVGGFSRSYSHGHCPDSRWFHTAEPGGGRNCQVVVKRRGALTMFLSHYGASHHWTVGLHSREDMERLVSDIVAMAEIADG